MTPVVTSPIEPTITIDNESSLDESSSAYERYQRNVEATLGKPSRKTHTTKNGFKDQSAVTSARPRSNRFSAETQRANLIAKIANWQMQCEQLDDSSQD